MRCNSRKASLFSWMSWNRLHVQAYLNAYVFRLNRRFYPVTAFNSVLRIGVRIEAPAYEDLYRSEWCHPKLTEVDEGASIG